MGSSVKIEELARQLVERSLPVSFDTSPDSVISHLVHAVSHMQAEREMRLLNESVFNAIYEQFISIIMISEGSYTAVECDLLKKFVGMVKNHAGWS